VTLIDPIAKSLMKTPCRSAHCNHLEAFDLDHFLEFTQQHAKWQCPVCDQKCELNDIEIDCYFEDIVKNIEKGVTEVAFFPDGNWEVHVKPKPAKKEINKDDVIIIIDD